MYVRNDDVGIKKKYTSEIRSITDISVIVQRKVHRTGSFDMNNRNTVDLGSFSTSDDLWAIKGDVNLVSPKSNDRSSFESSFNLY